jgi:hypothetical protein
MLDPMPETLPVLLRRLRLERALAAHDPTVVGARPLRLRADGPVVILCRSGPGFAARLRAVYGEHIGFTPLSDGEAEGCTFTLSDTPIQIIGRPQAVRQQRDFRVFQLQVHLLRLLGAPLAEQVTAGMDRHRSLEAAFGGAMGVAELLTLERAGPVKLREQWQQARRRPAPTPTPEAAPPPVAAPPESDAESDDLLRQPDPLLKERQVTWLDPARLLPVSRQDLPPPRRSPSQPTPRLPKKP